LVMQKSNDLSGVIKTISEQLHDLNITYSNVSFGIDSDDSDYNFWTLVSGQSDPVKITVPYIDHPITKAISESRKNKQNFLVDYFPAEVHSIWLNHAIEHSVLKSMPKEEKENLLSLPLTRSVALLPNIFLVVALYKNKPYSETDNAIIARFGQVFEQSYRRFLDLKKAEAQAREAHIEAALEKVRSRTMAMQSSSELRTAANLLFLEVQGLGINAWSAGYNILSEDKTQSVCWMSSEGELQDPFPLYYTQEASFIEMGAFLKSESDFFVQELGGQDLVQHYDYMTSLPELKETFQHLKDSGLSLPTYQINHLCKFSQGYLLFITYEKVTEAHDVFKRFTKVFEQTYTRFLDLKKAENQSKEARIELALERVRASTMAMHNSMQLAETAQVLFEQFDLLGVIPDRISIAIYNENKRRFELWSTDQRGKLVDHVHFFSIDEPICMAKTFKAFKEGNETFVLDIQGEDLEEWVRYVKEEAKMEIDVSNLEGRRVQHTAYFSQGYLMLSSHMPIKNESLQLLLRFAKVFQQTYTRFLDLKKAESQARDAIRHASVDRVRAEIASMRTTADLKRITPLVWNELNTLNVPFIRCGVFIMDEDLQRMQTHLSTSDGKAIASFELPFDDLKPLEQLLPYWRRKEMFTDYWDQAAFIESTKILMDKGMITSSETYSSGNQPKNLHLHFLPFLQGMLYVGSEISLSDEELNLVQNLAEAFSTAYSRYEDFSKLEMANKKIEKTLVDLKQAQSQLVQSEKMASLGELTAGIAHEIQNPLNFVNNFSEVSSELMEEMYEEIKNGDVEEALEIGSDIEQNLQKIHHHGKRASEIVKGMLQHSRSSSGVRELTDINALTDEYLRLAYHGLRAKDKTFNAKMESDFDPSIEKIEVIPQDFGRVILNLITNAFYAVDQKKKLVNGDFEPKVSVYTKKNKESIEIKVMDNGNGIPDNVLEKIFQPFFTTKPTGQGTGLGLSLSYDIVKAQGGELTVETIKGEGTEFIIKLPV
ncbi:sensor histidine kinase, partial [Lutimonas sp.]|uniref:sensor histidine kinase n=1 Tax=Lutimonas sp. TaxID=1872403 RepID=UPI003D9BCA8B